MAQASGVALSIQSLNLPVLPGALDLAREFLPCGGRANLRFFKGFAAAPDVASERQLICLDPQTSGGLLVALRPDASVTLTRTLESAGLTVAVIGEVVPQGDTDMRVQLH